MFPETRFLFLFLFPFLVGGAPLGYPLANALVLSKVKEALGLSKAHFLFSSAAPISVEVLQYFASWDLGLMEIYGQSECTGPHTTTLPTSWKMGTIGRTVGHVGIIQDPSFFGITKFSSTTCLPFQIHGFKSKVLDKTGEMCLWGRHIMMGYLHMESETRQAVDSEGWLHSGDVAQVDADGFWRITGRIKELIITAGGENIVSLCSR